MNSLVAESKGFKLGDFWIPPFELNEGELLSICLFSGEHFFDLEMKLVKFLTGIKAHPKISMYQKMEFVEHIKTNRLIDSVFPMTVGKYLRQFENVSVEEFKSVFDLDHISSETKVNSLGGSLRKYLSLLSTFSKSDKIIFDLAGQDSSGAAKAIKFIYKYIDRGGAAILLDNFEDLESKCTKYLKVELIK